MRIPSPPPANDNGLPAFLLVPTSAARRHDITQTDLLVLGAVHAYSAANMRPRAADLAAALGRSRSGKHCRIRDSIRKLEAAQLVRREFVNGADTRYAPWEALAANG